jgi:hypothetical protein
MRSEIQIEDRGVEGIPSSYVGYLLNASRDTARLLLGDGAGSAISGRTWWPPKGSPARNESGNLAP